MQTLGLDRGSSHATTATFEQTNRQESQYLLRPGPMFYLALSATEGLLGYKCLTNILA